MAGSGIFFFYQEGYFAGRKEVLEYQDKYIAEIKAHTKDLERDTEVIKGLAASLEQSTETIRKGIERIKELRNRSGGHGKCPPCFSTTTPGELPIGNWSMGEEKGE